MRIILMQEKLLHLLWVFTDMKRFIVYDSLGNPMKKCNTYEQAMTYKIMCQRYDWTIKEIRK